MFVLFGQWVSFPASADWYEGKAYRIGGMVGSDQGEYGTVYEIEGEGIPSGSVVKLYRGHQSLKGVIPPTKEEISRHWDAMKKHHDAQGDATIKPLSMIEHNGMLGIIMEGLCSGGIDFDHKVSSGAIPHANQLTIEQLLNVLSNYRRAGIIYDDLQFRVCPDGHIKLFDTDLIDQQFHGNFFLSLEFSTKFERYMTSRYQEVIARIKNLSEIEIDLCPFFIGLSKGA